MPAYHPGQGLNKEALERLRARMHAEGGGLHLPSQDESRQWDRLLGGDAKKKTRCGICTRPLSEEEEAAEQIICARCAKEQNSAAPSEPRLKPLAGKACSTPSTDAASEEGQDSEPLAAEPGPPAAHDVPAAPRPPVARPPAAAARPHPPPPSREQLEMATARKRLEGAWEGSDGSSYEVHFQRESTGACLDKASSRSFTLTCDHESQVIWWGLRKAYYISAADLCANADRVAWHPSSAISKGRQRYTWHRPQPTLVPSAPASEPVPVPAPAPAPAPATEPTQPVAPLAVPAAEEGEVRSAAQWPSPEVAKAHAIKEIEEQLGEPGGDGRVRVPRWNQRYRQALGTLRQFLESCPDRFSVTTTEGKEYTVELVRPPQPCGAAALPRRLPPPPPPPPPRPAAARPQPPPAPTAEPAPAAAEVKEAAAPEAPAQLQPRAQVRRRERPEAQEARAGGTKRWEPKLAPPSVPRVAPAEAATTAAEELSAAKVPASVEKPASAAEAPCPAKAPTSSRPSASGSQELEAEAIWRIEEQLWTPKSGGFVWIQNWNQRYARSLGSLRSFMEAQPEKFKVIPLHGKGYRVELVQ